MYLFLQNLRATIPTIAVPVVLLGTFAVLAAFGFSINTLTMFGMVLAIGLLVDDAIVVVENVERVMVEDKLPPKRARRSQWSRFRARWWGSPWSSLRYLFRWHFWWLDWGHLSPVLVNYRFRDGAIRAGRADPDHTALCATLLKPVSSDHHEKKEGFFGWFNALFDKSVEHYSNSVSGILRKTGRYLVVYVIIVGGMAVLFLRLPTSFLPEEDQGVFMTIVPTPAGRPRRVLRRSSTRFRTTIWAKRRRTLNPSSP